MSIKRRRTFRLRKEDVEVEITKYPYSIALKAPNDSYRFIARYTGSRLKPGAPKDDRAYRQVFTGNVVGDDLRALFGRLRLRLKEELDPKFKAVHAKMTKKDHLSVSGKLIVAGGGGSGAGGNIPPLQVKKPPKIQIRWKRPGHGKT